MLFCIKHLVKIKNNANEHRKKKHKKIFFFKEIKKKDASSLLVPFIVYIGKHHLASIWHGLFVSQSATTTTKMKINTKILQIARALFRRKKLTNLKKRQNTEIKKEATKEDYAYPEKENRQV